MTLTRNANLSRLERGLHNNLRKRRVFVRGVKFLCSLALFLICVITPVAKGELRVNRWRVLARVVKSKICASAFLESILVLDMAKTINGSNPSSYVCDLVGGERAVKPVRLKENRIAPQCEWKAFYVCLGKYQRRIFFNHSNNRDVHQAPNSISRSLTAVLEHHGHTGNISPIWVSGNSGGSIVQTPTLWQDVSPQLSMTVSDHNAYSRNQSKELQEANDDCTRRNFVAETPSFRLIICALVCVTCGFVLCLAGNYFDDERVFLRAALFGGGVLFGGFGFFSLWPIHNALWLCTWGRIL